MSKDAIKESLFGALIKSPILEEIVFRFVPFLIYQRIGYFIFIGILSSAIYALTHQKHGKLFIIYTFFFGLIAWVIVVNYGIIFAILAHSLLNIIDWKIGTRRILTKGKYTL